NGAAVGLLAIEPDPNISMLLGPVTTNGPWVEFGFGGAGTFATGCLPADPVGITHCYASPAGDSAILSTPPWTFTATEPVQLLVLDCGASGDQFEVFDNNVS